MSSNVNLIAVYHGISTILLLKKYWFQEMIFKWFYDKLTSRAGQIYYFDEVQILPTEKNLIN